MLRFFISFIFLCILSESYAQTVKLPDIAKVDSVRVIKRKASPADTVRSIQFITIEQGDTTRGALQDSAALANAIQSKIEQENSLASNTTFLLYQQFTKAKGLLEYGKLYKRVTRQNYVDWTWANRKTPYLGKWQLSGQGITAHVLTVGDDAKAIRDTGTPKYSGTFEILAPTRIQLSGYIPGNAVIVFDFVTRNTFQVQGQTVTREVFMSTDGRFFLEK